MDEKETWYEVEWSYAGADDWYRSTNPSTHDTQAEAAKTAKKIKNEVFDARVVEVIHHRRVVEVFDHRTENLNAAVNKYLNEGDAQ